MRQLMLAFVQTAGRGVMAATVAGIATYGVETTVAQTTDSELRALNEAVKRTVIERATAEPLGESTQPAAQHQLTVVADKGEVNGRARFYVPLGSYADGVMTFTGPLTNGAASLATADGLGKGVTFNGSIKITFWSKTTSAGAAGPLAELLSPRPAQTGARSTDTPLDELAKIRQQAATGATFGVPLADGASPSTPRTPVLDPRMRLARLANAKTLTSSPVRFYAAVVQAAPKLVANRTVVTLTPGFESQRKVVDYLKSDSYEQTTFDYTTTAVTLSGGLSKFIETTKDGQLGIVPLFYVGGALRAGTAVSVNDPQHVCRPIGTAGAQECLEGPVGVPLTGTGQSFTAEARWWAPGNSLGVNPRYTYGRKLPDGATEASVVHTVDVPIYFMRQVSDIQIREVPLGADLVGGVNLGWRSAGAAKGTFLTVFLSKAFGLP